MRVACQTRFDQWRQQRAVISTSALLPYAMLAILAGITAPLQMESDAAMTAVLALSGATALWMLLMRTLRPQWRQRSWYGPVFLTGLIALTGALVLLDTWFGFFAAICFAYSRALLPWPWQEAGAVATAVLSCLSQVGGVQASWPVETAIYAFVLALDLLFLCSLMWLLWEREERVKQLQRTAAENADLHEQLVAQAREAGMLDERRRMAREIHDTLAQGLTGIVTQLQAAEQVAESAPGDPAGWRRHVTAATQLARDSLSEARRSVEALRPEPLECGRLSEALGDVAGRWSALNQIPVQVTTTGTVRPVDPEAEFALLRAAQEALANVARHARASRVGLTVSYMENEVAVDVRDDGAGFDPARSRPGFGLVAMRQRITALSGTLQVESEPGHGTAVSACVPIGPALPPARPAPSAGTVSLARS
jgi:signal transduction histidine kinase